MGTIVLKEAGHLLPDDFLKLVLKKYSKGYGAAIPSGGSLEILQSKDAWTSMDKALEEINDIQVKLKDDPLVFYFTNYDNPKMPADSCQPFLVLADGEGENMDPQVCIFIEGEIDDTYEPEGSDNTRAYMAVNMSLGLKLQKMYAECDNDTDALVEAIGKPGMKKELCSPVFDGPGALVFVTAAGDVCVMATKDFDTDKDEDWGWTSEVFEEEETPNLGEKIVAAAQGVLSTIKPTGVLSTVKAKVSATTSPKPEVAKEADQVWARPPAHILKESNNKKKGWYEKRTAIVPSNWKECPAILMDRAVAVKEGCKIVEPPKKPLPDGVHEIKDKEEAVPIPLIPDAQRDYIVNDFLKNAVIAKTLDASSNAVPNPADMEADLKKYPSFCEKVGLLGLEQTFKWDFPSVLKLTKNAPDAAARLLMDYKFAVIHSHTEKPQVDIKPPSTAAKNDVNKVIPKVERKSRRV